MLMTLTLFVGSTEGESVGAIDAGCMEEDAERHEKRLFAHRQWMFHNINSQFQR